MGFFSWDTADTKDSIMNIHSGAENEVVYLVQPKGKNIEETEYEGYGEFGGVDAYEWLAEHNISKEILARAEALNIEKRLLGIYLDYKYYIDTRTDKKYSYVFTNLFEDLNDFENYGEEVEGVVVNELIKSGVWVEMPISDYLGEITVPLKFSYNELAVYDLLEASEIADNQGFFYSEEEDEYEEDEECEW